MADKSYEDLFLETLQSYRPDQENRASGEFLKHLTPHSQKRWQIYAEGYVSRIASALASSLLERVSALYDEDFVKHLIFSYISAHPPQTQLMPDCLGGFVAYLKEESAHKDRTDLIDLVRLSLARWQVLIAKDPDPARSAIFSEATDLSKVYFQQQHALVHSEAPIHSLWQTAEQRMNEEAFEETLVLDRAESVLLFKSSATVLHCLRIAPEFHAFVEALSSGTPLLSALERIDFAEAQSEQNFIALLTELQQSKAFETVG